MGSLSLGEENIYKDIRNLFRLKKKKKPALQLKIEQIFLDQKNKLKQLKLEYLEILRIFLRMKKTKMFINLQGFIYGVTLNTKVTVTQIKHYQLKNILTKLDHI